ncbi:MAG TPA: hypothetical protein VG817_03140 [Gemmatimonadales bacterium]|nr:hypothetical protein [Gemmatimonadales bacterium]
MSTSIPHWVRATTLGWLLGIPLIIVFALAGEAIGIGGVQSLVGAGVGMGVGLMQGRALRPRLGSPAPWIIASTLGLALPFIIYDVSVALKRPLPYQLQAVVAIGGLVVGLWQSVLLKPKYQNSGIWIGASLMGWALAAAAAYGGDVIRFTNIRGIIGALLYLGTIVVGGPALGLVTGLALKRLVPRHPGTSE